MIDLDTKALIRTLRETAKDLDGFERLTQIERAELAWFREMWSRTHRNGPMVEDMKPGKTSIISIGTFTLTQRRE